MMAEPHPVNELQKRIKILEEQVLQQQQVIQELQQQLHQFRLTPNQNDNGTFSQNKNNTHQNNSRKRTRVFNFVECNDAVLKKDEIYWCGPSTTTFGIELTCDQRA